MKYTSLPKDVMTTEEAIKLIEQETREKPKLDIQFMAANLPYLREGYPYNMRMLTRDAFGKIVQNGTKYAYVKDHKDAVLLESAIREKFRELAHKEFELPLRKVTNEITDAESGGNMMGVTTSNTRSTIKAGDNI